MKTAQDTIPPSAGKSRSLLLNGTGLTTHAATLAELLAECGYGADKVATAVNGDFVPERARARTTIGDGDRIEVVSPRQGG